MKLDSFRPHEVSVGQSVHHDDRWIYRAFADLMLTASYEQSLPLWFEPVK